MVPLSAYVAVSAVLFITGLLGVLIRRNFIIVLMAVEIMLNAANINLVAFSYYFESMAGQLVAMLLSRLAVPVLYFLVARRGRAAELQREGAIARSEEAEAERAHAGPAAELAA